LPDAPPQATGRSLPSATADANDSLGFRAVRAPRFCGWNCLPFMRYSSRMELKDRLGDGTSWAPRERAAAWLTAGRLRPTRQRLALAELLVGDGCNRHVTAEGLHDAAARLGAPVSLATVYNTLRAFCRAGLVSEVTVDGTRSYFDTRVDDHPHYYWEEDGRLTDAPNDAVMLAGAPRAPQGAVVSRVDVVIRLRRAD
jgi:Fur family iron response transcriptional regulator